MANEALYVGLDYHTSGVQVCAIDPAGRVFVNRSMANDVREIQRVVGCLPGTPRVAIEACTGAADLAEQLTEQSGWCVSLAHAGYVARLRQQPDKTDFSDARLLADLERVGYLPRVWLAPAVIRDLRRVVRYRQQLVNERRSIKQRIGALVRDHRAQAPNIRRWTLRWMLWLERGEEFSEHTRWIMGRQLDRLHMLRGEIAASLREDES